MLIDSRELTDGTEINGSVAIIGAGAAGITLALELSKKFDDVLLLESGGLEFEQQTQHLNDGRLLGHKAASLEASRLRYLGGTTNHWNGQCAPLDPIDFEPIAGRTHSGWPFRLEELRPYYKRAYTYCELGAYREQKSPFAVEQAKPAYRQMIDGAELDVAEFRHSPPTRFGQRYRSALRSSNKVKAYLHANVVDMSISSDGRSVSSLAVKTLAGQRFEVKALAHVLCCGGIENARALLNFNRRFPKGIGNERDLVGRFFMDHLEVHDTVIVPSKRGFDFSPLDFQVEEGVRVSAALKNPPEVVRRPGRKGCSLVMDLEMDMPENVQTAQSSPAYAAFRQLTRNARLGNVPTRVGPGECEVLGGAGSIATVLLHRLNLRISGKSDVTGISVRLEGEQSPNPDSRVMLTDEVDELGMRRAGLDWRITDEDRDNVYQSVMTLARAVGATGFGRVNVPMKDDRDQSMIHSAYHHMGTTRMHEDPSQGVVDPNCRMHSLENLYIAGSSVFPTGGRVNPTLTIVALAVRLADHLSTKVKAR